MCYLRMILVGGIVLGAVAGWGQDSTPTQDSLLRFLTNNETAVREIVNGYKRISFSWTQLIATFGAVIVLGGLTWKFWGKEKLSAFTKQKAQEAIDNMSNLKTANILVVGGKESSTVFLESFFSAKQFSNVRFETSPGFTPHLIFANNEDGTLDKDAVRSMVKDDMVLFYFGKSGSWDYAKDTPELSRKINFANSRAQIYGNLMSSLEFLELVKPKIKNV